LPGDIVNQEERLENRDWLFAIRYSLFEIGELTEAFWLVNSHFMTIRNGAGSCPLSPGERVRVRGLFTHIGN
jgi:hypothetical protein